MPKTTGELEIRARERLTGGDLFEGEDGGVSDSDSSTTSVSSRESTRSSSTYANQNRGSLPQLKTRHRQKQRSSQPAEPLQQNQPIRRRKDSQPPTSPKAKQARSNSQQ